MKEAGISFNQTYVAHDEAPKVPQPSKRPLHDPPPSIARELATILMGPALVGGTCRNDGFNALPGQTRRQRIAVIPPIHNQALRPLAGPAGFAWTADRDGAEVRFKARAPRRGCRAQVCSQRSPYTIDQHHLLRVLASLRLADFGPLFSPG